MSPDLELKKLTVEDRPMVDTFLCTSRHVHRHWDFCSPLDGMETRSYLGLYQEEEIVGVIGCPSGTGSVIWLRLFAADPVFNLRLIWRVLWDAAKNQLSAQAPVNVLASAFWLPELLRESSFQHINDIVVMEGKPSSVDRPTDPTGISIQWMREENLGPVYEIDQAAFAPMWRISPENVKRAFLKGNVATIATDGEKIIGYQISTANAQGAELMRIAVHPEHQGKRVGTALLNHLLQATSSWGNLNFSVNTQKTNRHSIQLYKNFGLTKRRSTNPVFQYSIS